MAGKNKKKAETVYLVCEETGDYEAFRNADQRGARTGRGREGSR